jgi:hypothetical protein
MINTNIFSGKNKEFGILQRLILSLANIYGVGYVFHPWDWEFFK